MSDEDIKAFKQLLEGIQKELRAIVNLKKKEYVDNNMGFAREITKIREGRDQNQMSNEKFNSNIKVIQHNVEALAEAIAYGNPPRK